MSATVLVAAGATAIAVFLLVWVLIGALSSPTSEGEIGETWASRVVNRTLSKSRKERIQMMLSVAQVSIKASEWTMMRTIAGIVLAVVFGALGGWLWAAIGAILGLALSGGWLRWRVAKKRGLFEEDLIEVLQLIAGSLRSGMGLSDALLVATADGREPVVSEFKRVLSKARLGQSLEDGFEEVAERMNSQDFLWIALAVRIQKEVGGNLAEILEATAETMKERFYLKRQIKTLSAEGKLSAYILMVLPLLMASFFLITKPEYMAPLWTNPLGLMMLAGAVFSMVVGGFWMKATVRIDS